MRKQAGNSTFPRISEKCICLGAEPNGAGLDFPDKLPEAANSALALSLAAPHGQLGSFPTGNINKEDRMSLPDTYTTGVSEVV